MNKRKEEKGRRGRERQKEERQQKKSESRTWVVRMKCCQNTLFLRTQIHMRF